MVQESILEEDFIFLIQTKDHTLEERLSESVDRENVRFVSIERSEDLKEQSPEGQIITFIIGSDIEDPIQSAQRLHAFKKRARIILLAKSEKNAAVLNEVVKFSPFIGSDIYCLDESDRSQVENNLNKILQESLNAEKYRAVIAESNYQLSSSERPGKEAFSQNFINKFMDIAPVGIAIVGRKGKILGWNKEAASIFNKNEARVLGSLFTQLFGPDETARLEKYLQESFKKGEIRRKETLLLERENGDRTTQALNITTAPFTYSRGTGKALILAIKDETERERAKQELLKMNETLEERVKERTASLLSYQKQLRSLASKLSKTEEKERHRLATELHDNLGQMLAVSKMKMDLLPKRNLTKEAAKSLKEIRELMNDALIYTRELMSDLKPPPSLNKEDTRAAIKWLAEKMEKHGLNVIVKDDGKTKRTSEEIRTTLLQSVRELLFNVIKHTTEKEAFVNMSRTEDQIQITVEDKGRGMDTDLKSLSTEEGRFGLFNIKERMDLLGGSLEIKSGQKGTKAILRAPLYGDQSKAAVPDDETPTGEQTEGPEKIKVLLADDHQMMREGLKKIVDAEKDLTVVAEASDGREAIELTRKTLPDVIVMDINMPEMDGIEATQKIKASFPDVRIIGLSLYDDEKVIENIRSAGATAYLSKNEAFETLCATIRSEAPSAK